jgi:hypothetical protein
MSGFHILLCLRLRPLKLLIQRRRLGATPRFETRPQLSREISGSLKSVRVRLAEHVSSVRFSNPTSDLRLTPSEFLFFGYTQKRTPRI